MTDTQAAQPLVNGEYKVVYHVEVRDLVRLDTECTLWDGLNLQSDLLVQYNPDIDRPEDDEEWSGIVIRTAIDNLTLYDKFDGAFFYLGHWAEDTTSPVAVLGKEMDTYGQDIVYNGWRVTVTAHEISWGLE